MFNKEKFMKFYKGTQYEKTAEQCFDAIYSELNQGICSCCGQTMVGGNIPVNEKFLAGILATINTEVGRTFVPILENLNYSAYGLLQTFPKYFTPAQANAYQFQPERIANHVYANRMGNGPESSGDGWAHRGAGWGQTTGKTNQVKYRINPSNYSDFKVNAYAIVNFFRDNGLDKLCMSAKNDADWTIIRKTYNGGTNGLERFLSVVNQYLK